MPVDTKEENGRKSTIIHNDGKVMEKVRKVFLTDKHCVDIFNVTEVRVGKTSLRIKGQTREYVQGTLADVDIIHIFYIDKIRYMKIYPADDMVTI